MQQKELFPLKKYCLDANSLRVLTKYYIKTSSDGLLSPIKEKIEAMIRTGQIISSSEVYRELENFTDTYEWCDKNKAIFKDIDNFQGEKITIILKHYDKSYRDSKLLNTSPWADPCLIALALSENDTIVTEESKDKLNNIPKIASSFGVKSVSLHEFFEEIGIKL